ncbi:MAG: DUF1902 domain-containing protein [Roseovarius sp.]|nr:DUF1902 domain-containing protein [Roseovarius sp.]MCY4208179.1 DUF1902 domain-containing protein [Roseovarius sp.]MCY4290661.1 DUF1902 domain-containing protein [Roseovarius sp.]MCY4316638.1 DUF1902 domain-containing protein [Roseovarius sp.]
MQHEFTVKLIVDEDGIIMAQGEDIQGLVLETKSMEEMSKELVRLIPRLLRSNHNLSDDEIANALIHIVDGRQEQRPSRSPRLMWEDTLPVRAVA